MLFVRLALGSDEKVPSDRETKPPWAIVPLLLIATGSFQPGADATGWDEAEADGDTSRAALTGGDVAGVVRTAGLLAPLPQPASASISPATRMRTPTQTRAASQRYATVARDTS